MRFLGAKKGYLHLIFFFILIFVSLLGEFLFFIFVLCLCLFVFFLFTQRKRDCFPKRLFMVHTIKNKL